MLEGKTKSGFAYKVEDDALDDWELLEALTKLDDGDPLVVVKIPKLLLGEEQANALKEHLRNKNGRVKATQMTEEIGEIMNSNQEAKNS